MNVYKWEQIFDKKIGILPRLAMMYAKAFATAKLDLKDLVSLDQARLESLGVNRRDSGHIAAWCRETAEKLKDPIFREQLEDEIYQWKDQLDDVHQSLRGPGFIPRHKRMWTATRGDFTDDNDINKEFLGQGAFSKIWIVREKKSGKKFAMKVMRKRFLSDHGFLADAYREQHTLARLDHPFIIFLHTAFETRLELFFILDCHQTKNLEDYFEELEYFSDEVSQWYSAELIEALHYLRSCEIVHRDVKKENILLSHTNHLVLTDFGTCVLLCEKPRRLDRHWHAPQPSPYDEDLRKVRTEKRVINNRHVGTSSYVPPEVLTNEPLSYGTDLWALGCLLFEFHCGMKAFKPGALKAWGRDMAAYHSQLTAGFGWPDGFPTNHKLANLVDRLLQPETKQRIGVKDMKELKSHAFYQDLPCQWDTLDQNRPPPIRAPTSGPRPPQIDPNKDKPFSWDDYYYEPEIPVYSYVPQPSMGLWKRTCDEAGTSEDPGNQSAESMNPPDQEGRECDKPCSIS